MWWKKWSSQVFNSLLPIHHWLDKKKNPMLGNVVLVKYEAKYGKPSYRLAKMLATKEEVSILVNLDGANTEAASTRPQMPIVTLDLPAVEYTAEDVH